MSRRRWPPLSRSLWFSRVALVLPALRIEWRRGRRVRSYAAGFRSLGNLIVDPHGVLVVTDRGAGRVYRIDDRGSKQIIGGSGRDGGGPGIPAIDASLEGVRAVWFDDRGGMFLAPTNPAQCGTSAPTASRRSSSTTPRSARFAAAASIVGAV